MRKLLFLFAALFIYTGTVAIGAEPVRVRVSPRPLSARLLSFLLPPTAFFAAEETFCYAQDLYGQSYEASGRQPAEVIQRVAMQACYGQSPAPESCRAAGCR